MIRIDDPADPRIEHYRSVKDRDLSGRGGRFMAEGEVVLRNLLSPGCRFSAESILLSEARARSSGDLLAALPADLPVYVAPQVVMDAIVGFHIHRGVLAVAFRGERPTADEVLAGLPQRALVLGLVGLANHDNVGAAFRNAAAVGAGAVLLDQTSCDPLYRKALRVSVGAPLLLPHGWSDNADEMVRSLESAGFSVVALSPQGTRPLETCAWPERTALLVGAEGPGLPASLLARVGTVRITMAGGFDSLNVATAAGIALHAVRTGQAARAGD
jgi:tRNA G18 (ribose-2'-O)-methylase SpoU